MTMTAKMNLMMMMISRITARSLKDEFKDYEYDIKDNSSLPHLQYGVVPEAVPEHLLEEADHGPDEAVGRVLVVLPVDITQYTAYNAEQVLHTAPSIC